MQDITLGPGDIHFGGGCSRLRTLLGSCVAITLWHPARRIGGMCHYQLPAAGARQRLPDGHYADRAIAYFVRTLRAAGTHPNEYEIKLFGGGNMFDAAMVRASTLNVAQNNVDAGRNLLRQHGFAITVADVGGVRYRKIHFELWSGDVWVQYGKRAGCEES